MDNRTLIRAEALLAEARSMMETFMNKLQENFDERMRNGGSPMLARPLESRLNG